jgi:thiamine kinase-like enzyme
MDALSEVGVDWNFIRSEINALSLGTTLFPTTGLSTHVVNVHGDSHVGNIMRTSTTEGELRLIDFDMCTPGPVCRVSFELSVMFLF